MTGTRQRTIWRWLAAAVGAAAILGASELALRLRYRERVLPDNGQITIVALGDSITAGDWPTLLAKELGASFPAVTWRVVNAGVPGDTAPLGFARFDRDVAAAGPQLVLIAFGLNDCHPARYGMDRWLEARVPRGLGRSFFWRAIRVRLGRWSQRAGGLPPPRPETDRVPQPRTSPDGFAAALAALVERARLVGAWPVLLTMTPLADPWNVPDRGQAEGVRVRAATYPAYNALIRQRAARDRVLLVELATDAPSGAFAPDGIHLIAAGQAWVADQVFRQLADAGVWTNLAAKRPRRACPFDWLRASSEILSEVEGRRGEAARR